MEKSPFTGETMINEGRIETKIIYETIQTDIEEPIQKGQIIPAARFDHILDLYTDPNKKFTPEQMAELKRQLTILADTIINKKLYEKGTEASWKVYQKELHAD